MSDNFLREWVKNNAGIDLSLFQEKCFEILCHAYRCGVYDLPISWKALRQKEECSKQYNLNNHYFAVNIGQRNGLATIDSNGLTNLVIGAHDNCIRVSIEAIAPRLYKIRMHKRHCREGEISRRHPTIEQAVAQYRKYYGEPMEIQS